MKIQLWIGSDSEKRAKESPNDREEKAGEKPAHNLGIDMVFASLPVGIYPQTAQYAAYGTDHQHQVRKVEIQAVDFIACV